MNVVTYDESWMHYFEPHRKISNRVWLTKMSYNIIGCITFDPALIIHFATALI